MCVYVYVVGWWSVILLWELSGSGRLTETDSQCLSESVAGCFRGSGEHEWRILQSDASGSDTVISDKPPSAPGV